MHSPPNMYSSVVQLVHVGWKIIEYTVVHATSYVLLNIPLLPVYTTLSTAVLSTSYILSTYYIFFCCTACTRRLEDNRIYRCTRNLVCTLLYFRCMQRLLGIRVYCCALCTSRRYYLIACCSNVPCFTANREYRRAAGQLAAQENARYENSYLRAFVPARPLHLESWVQRDGTCGPRWGWSTALEGTLSTWCGHMEKKLLLFRISKSCVWKGIQGLFGPVTLAMKGASPSRPLRRPGVPWVTTEATRHVNKYPWPCAGR